jgi:hypothetical protein
MNVVWTTLRARLYITAFKTACTHTGRLSFFRDGREQQQREPPRTADTVHQPDAVG